MIFTLVLILVALSSAFAHSKVLAKENPTVFTCTGKVDGFTISIVNQHIVSIDNPGVEVSYYRVLSKNGNKITAVSVFDGYKIPIDGVLSSDKISTEKITIETHESSINFERESRKFICNS